MPNVKITWLQGRTPEQKRKIAERITVALEEEGSVKRENVHICFVDLPATDYVVAGVPMADRKRTP
jgi:4-oxalocrotonate tautomerase